MYLLDTNIVSLLDTRRQAQAPALIDWLERNGANVYLSVMTIAEMEAGIQKLEREDKTARARELAGLLSEILASFSSRVLAVDIETARHVARLGELTHRQPVSLPDLIIAATAVRNGLTVLTCNMSEFGRLGISARDPLADPPPDV